MDYSSASTQVIDLLRETFNDDTFKAFFDGDPVWIPTSMLPCIAVVTEQSDTVEGAIGIDELKQTISIRVIVNLSTYAGGSMTVETAHQAIKAFVEARDDNGQYKDKTVVGALRRNFTLGNSLVGQNISVKYDILTEGRVTDSKKGQLTEEAHITFTAKQLVPVPVRV